ncbi:adenosine deaminase [Actinopolymorpha singaporensis]
MSGARPEVRPLDTLPKAHLHLHFTGSMRHETLVELAGQHGLHLPEALRDEWPPHLLATDEKGWFRFQRLYDIARSVLVTADDVRRLVRETVEDEAREGSGWLEIQVDPSGYASRFGGITAFTELVLDAVRQAADRTGVGVGLVIAANRTRHPLDARTLARLATQYAGHGVVGFGLSNDERRGRPEEFARAFSIATAAGLGSMPHGGELCGPDSVRGCLDLLGATRVGHGVRTVEDPALLDRVAEAGVPLEVCPASNVALGVYPEPEVVPLRKLFDAGARIALGADDPLLFGVRLVGQYELARGLGFTDAELAELARMSVRASTAPSSVRDRLLDGVDRWLAEPAEAEEPAKVAQPPEHERIRAGGASTSAANGPQWWEDRLEALGLPVGQPLGAGMDGVVYAVDDDTVAKVWFRHSPATLHRLRDFYADLDAAGLPFATPCIHAVRAADGTPVTIERRLHGRPLSEFVSANGPTEAALRTFVDVLAALRETKGGPSARALPVMAEEDAFYRDAGSSWPTALRALVDRRAEAYGDVLRSAVPGFDALLERVRAGLRALPDGEAAVVHGDLCPPNILVEQESEGCDLRVTAVLDWAFLTTAGDPAFDASLAAGFFDMYGPKAREIDQTLSGRIVARFGYPPPLLHLYRACYAIVGANAYDPTGGDGHFAWCADQLRRPDLRAALGL